MRTFIAIELPQEIKSQLAKIQKQLSASGADAKWVEPENIHLTLKFLGEINPEQQNQIIAILKEIGAKHSEFFAQITSVGAFPKLDYPRIIWAGIDQGNKEIKAIAQKLEEELEKIGIPKEGREFASHITIARVRSGKNRIELVKALNNLPGKLEVAEFKVEKISLFKSTLTSSGPLYQPLQEIILQTA